MTRLAYHLLDVFSSRALAGNPLAILPEADGLTTAQMQAIAREFNLSETVFILTPRESVHTARLRIFSPATELPFAGHPTIGAAWLIAHLRAPEMIGRQSLRLVLEEEAGAVLCDVARVNGFVRANFIAPRRPELLGALEDGEKIAAALGLAASDIGFGTHRPVLASAGLAFAFVPVKSLDALRRAGLSGGDPTGIFCLERPAVCVYAPETATPENHVQARVFAPGLGIAEDPATGSAAAAFASIACAFERPEDGEHTIVIEQGFCIDRPSEIVVTMEVEGGRLVQASVGGACVEVGEGFLTI